MIRVRIGLDDDVYDTYDKWGLIYVSSDHRLNAPVRDFDKTEYAEKHGENIDARTTMAPFDYKVKFMVVAPNSNLENANAKIRAFNESLYSRKPWSDVRIMKKLTLYNDYKRVKIEGYPKPISEATDFYRRANGEVADAVGAELTIRVANPAACDFSMVHRVFSREFAETFE